MTTLDSRLDLPPLELRTHGHLGASPRFAGGWASTRRQAGANRRDVELAAAEVVTNAVVHAFVGRDNGVISVRAEIEGPNQLLVGSRQWLRNSGPRQPRRTLPKR